MGDLGSLEIGGGAVVSDSSTVDSDLTPDSEEGFSKFLLRNNGVLFENDVMQIGVKSEYKKNLGECSVVHVLGVCDVCTVCVGYVLVNVCMFGVCLVSVCCMCVVFVTSAMS